MDLLQKPQLITHAHKSLNFTLYDTRWIPHSARFVVLGSHPRGTGALQIYELTRGDANILKEAEKRSPFKCGTFGAGTIQERHLATGDFAGHMMVWDLEKVDMPVYSVKSHSEIVNSIDGCGGLGIGGGAPEIVTGSRDGSVKVWDVRQKDDPVACMEPAEGEQRRDCWTVAFGNSYNNSERCVAAGYDNGDIKMFDLRTMSLRWEENVKNGVCSLEFDRKDIRMNKLVATSLGAKFYVFDTRTQHPKKGFPCLTEKAHKSTIWCVRHLPQNRDIFMTTGGNGTLNLWKYSYPEKRVKTDGDGVSEGVVGSLDMLQNATITTQPISSFDWNADKEGLCVFTSFDQCFRVLIATKLNIV
ncbi:dynein axonemal assembly factor 10-like [Corticium candelabrum]|uniref:dynein axonemal assembly factor 10-like n=1 Tax=Corticium candelabrum TaxID=121492 RepID=UPI002E25B59B|nr:dynein axonemal assembly factor 10-like [Corticium candelabrum]